MQITEHVQPRPETRGRRIGVTPNDRIWYVDYAKGFLGRYDPKTKEFKEWPLPSGGASRPYGMTTDDQGRVWVVESGVQPNKFVGFDPKTEQLTSRTSQAVGRLCVTCSSTSPPARSGSAPTPGPSAARSCPDPVVALPSPDCGGRPSVATAAGFMRDRPPEAHTGGFGEPTCQECHSGEPLNQAPGAISLAGLTEAYEPGRRYELTVLLTAPELQVGGFELAARFSDARQAGRFEPTNGRRSRHPLTSWNRVHNAHA